MSTGRFKIAVGAVLCILAAGAVFGFLALSGGAGTEPQAQSAAKPRQPQLQFGPAAQSAPAPTTSAHSNWVVRCASMRDKLDCRAGQSIFLDGRRGRVLSVAVRVPAETKKPLMLIRLPLGVYLPAGVSLQFGNDVAKLVPYAACGRGGCVAQYPIAEAELVAMLNAADLKVSAQNKVSAENQDKQPAFTVRVPAAGFATAYAKIK